MGDYQLPPRSSSTSLRSERAAGNVAIVLFDTKSESYNPDSKQADCVGANTVCPAQPGLAKADLV